MTTFLLIAHSLLAVALLGALTHQAASIWWPTRVGDAHFIARFRAVKAAHFVNATVVLYVVTFAMGAILYPVYRIGARLFMEELRMSAAVGSFEMKEHLVALGLGLLPAYWYVWRRPLLPQHATTRKVLTLMLALFVWAGFLVGHVLNNIRGL